MGNGHNGVPLMGRKADLHSTAVPRYRWGVKSS